MGLLIILRSYDRLPQVGERLAEGRLIETKSLQDNRLNYQRLNDDITVIVDKVYPVQNDICIVESNSSQYVCMMAKMRKRSNIYLNQGKLEIKKAQFMLKLIGTENYDLGFSPIYGPCIAFCKTVYAPTSELKKVYEHVFLDKNDVVIID